MESGQSEKEKDLWLGIGGGFCDPFTHVISFGRVVEEMVPMRDGTSLLTLILMPEGSPPSEGWPSVLQRTPYNARGYLVRAFVDQGFVSIAQDLRGYHGSEGEKGIYQSDGWGKKQDGVDTLEWIARQPWSNGKICTYGGSAGAAT